MVRRLNLRKIQYKLHSCIIVPSENSSLRNRADSRGVVKVRRAGISKTLADTRECDTAIDQMIFGSAQDVSLLTQFWKWNDTGLGVQSWAPVLEKNFTTLIEEYPLNASLNLMSLLVYK